MPRRDKETLASNIDIAPTILQACGIKPDRAMSGELDAKKTTRDLAKRDRIFVDVYWDNIRVDALGDLDSDLIARVVIDGWDKLIARPDGLELYDLKNDPDDRTDLAEQNHKKVEELSVMNDWLEETPTIFPMLPNVNMINLRTSSYFLPAIALLAVLLALNLSKANAASDDQIVAADLLTVKEPKSKPSPGCGSFA